MDQIERLQRELRKFVDERDWSQFHSGKDLAISLSLEASEVLELFQWQPDDLPTADEPDKRHELEDELSDVFYWLLMLADRYQVDLPSALDAKLEKNRAKYPIEKARGVSKKYTKL